MATAMTTAATAAPDPPAPPPGEAAALAKQQQQPPPEEREPPVPSTLQDLLRTFFSQPSILGASAAITATAAARLHAAPPLFFSSSSSPAAAASEAALCVAAFAAWSVSEHLIHSHLLHPTTKDGAPLDPIREHLRRTHEQHHERAYLHVSVDGPALVAGFMLGTGALWWGAASLLGAAFSSAASAAASATSVPLSENPLFLSFLTAYWSAGLLYELVHYAVHTRFVPRGRSWPARYLRAVRRHHILHHCRSERHWLAFTVPQVDALFGTRPGGEERLPAMTPMARRAAEAWRQPAA
jgi:hypothetical protein